MKTLRFIILGILVVPPTLFLSCINSAKAVSCNDVIFVFARGSGEPLNGDSYQEFKNKIKENIPDSSLKYDFYELGSTSQDGHQYPAVEIGIDTFNKTITTIGAAVGAGDAYTFGSSVKSGEKELSTYIKSINSTCKNTKFVIAGYSQGGLVISNAIKDINSSKIIYAATFGDPKLYLPEGYGKIPAACLGKNLSNYRAYVPDCRTYEGILGKNNPYQPADYLDKLGAWCNFQDIMCSKYFSTLNPIEGHTSYISGNLYENFAKVIKNKLTESLGGEASETETVSSSHDVAILIDSTGSMSSLINKYKNEA